MNRIIDEQTLTHLKGQCSHTIFAYLMAAGPKHPDWLIVLAEGDSPSHEFGDPNDPEYKHIVYIHQAEEDGS